MDKGFKLKDSLYYSDLIYEIKKLAGFDMDVDFSVWERIAERKKDIRVDEKINGSLCTSYCLSPFQKDLFEIVREMSKKVGISFNGLEEISKYPLLVLDALAELENRDLENKMLIHLVSVVKDMGLENKFSLGEAKEQCVCLNKVNKIWEVFIIERDMTFEKDIFEDCFDACLQVIHHLADSKQMYEEATESFEMVKKLIPKK